MKTINCEQLSPEWYKARAGVPSASRSSEIITSQGKPSASAKKYMYQLAIEAINQTKEETFQSFKMKQATEMEEEARIFYELYTNTQADKIGFCLHDTINFGASPDFMVGEDGQGEIKCTNNATYVEYLLADKLPTTYLPQVQSQLFVTGRKWCDFMVYVPGIKPFIKRVLPDLEFHRKLEIELIKFNEGLTKLIERLK